VLALAELAEEQGCGIEDWESIRRLCAACSRGSPSPHAAPEHVGGPTMATLAIAARDDIALGALLNRWAAARPGRAAREISILLPGAPQTLS
jgi:hypothetical protein